MYVRIFGERLTVCGSSTVRQSRFHSRKNASCSVSCRCSMSTSGASSSSGPSSFSSSSSATSASAFVLWDGRQVAAEGMAGPESAGVMTRPSVAKICSASSATAAIAAARSSLNWRRSARRRAVTSSDVSSASQRLKCQDMSSNAVRRTHACRRSRGGSSGARASWARSAKGRPCRRTRGATKSANALASQPKQSASSGRKHLRSVGSRRARAIDRAGLARSRCGSAAAR